MASLRLCSALLAKQLHGHWYKATVVKVASKALTSDLVDANHCQGLVTLNASYFDEQ